MGGTSSFNPVSSIIMNSFFEFPVWDISRFILNEAGDDVESSWRGRQSASVTKQRHRDAQDISQSNHPSSKSRCKPVEACEQPSPARLGSS
jgi:hypothetical protein